MGREGPSSRASSPFLSSFLILIPLFAVFLLLCRATDNPPDLSAYPWLYLRDDEVLVPAENAVEMIAVGDVMLGRGVADQPNPLGDVASWLRQAHLAVGNLECVVTSDSQRGSLLQAAPSAVGRVRDAGFDVLGLANNHALDLGPERLAETASRLRAAEIAPLGGGPDREAAFQPLIQDIDGVRLALLAFNAVADPRGSSCSGGWVRADWDRERVRAAVAAAADRTDAVIVSIHWGYEYETSVDPAQREAARALLAAGADLVIGHHPHVVQPFEVYDDRCVAYSLGNFVFDQAQGETGQGLALRAFFDGQGLRAVQALPAWGGVHPRLMTPAEAGTLLARVGPPPRRLSFACDDRTCHRVGTPPQAARETRSGLFWGGQIDLTGDGVPEHVRRMDEHVAVHSDGVEVWRSPPEWRVVDVAPGDPNDDGRGELLLALWKVGLDGLETPSPEKEHIPRSHPFIVGYRGGTYRTLWGGSAVGIPIHEVELGDVVGDRSQELIVLEGADSSGQTISVWRWHGWGFSLTWRSEPGAYRDLMLGEDGVISAAVE
jgi:poly-gamma-glutamate synthesis protein (capsule biosynthesis protein)